LKGLRNSTSSQKKTNNKKVEYKMANKTIINKYGYEVVAPTRCKSAIKGQSLKIGDTVETICDLLGGKVKQGEQFKIKLMWKNKYATVLEFEGTDWSCASTAFIKVQ
jgi:hypothetical protein